MFWRSVRSSSIIFDKFIWVSVPRPGVSDEEQLLKGFERLATAPLAPKLISSVSGQLERFNSQKGLLGEGGRFVAISQLWLILIDSDQLHSA